MRTLTVTIKTITVGAALALLAALTLAGPAHATDDAKIRSTTITTPRCLACPTTTTTDKHGHPDR